MRTNNITNFQSGSNYTNFTWIILDKYLQIIKSDDQTSMIKYQSYNWLNNNNTVEVFVFVLEGDLKMKSDGGFYNMTYNQIYAMPGESYRNYNLIKN